MPRKKFSVHYAWIICFAGTLLFFITVGLSSNCYSVYQPYFRDAFALSETRLSFMNTCRQIAGIIAMMVIGLYYRKISLKWGLILSALMSSIGFVLFSAAKSYYILVLACLLTGFGNNLGGMVAISMMLDRWFVKKRSIAVSICSSASGIATFLAPKLITGCISRIGLSATLAVQSAIMLLLTLLCAVLFCESPERKQLTAYGEGCDTASENAVHREPAELPKFIRALIFFMIFLTGGLSGCAIAMLPLLAKSQGYSDVVMANAVSFAGLALLAGKLLYGWLCERITQYKTSMIFGSIMVAGLILLCFSSAGTSVLYLGSILYTGTLAMITIGLVTWTVDWFKQKDWIRCRSVWMLIFNIGALVFSIVPGVLADRFDGSYLPVFYIFLAESVITLIVICFTYRYARK